MKRFVIIYFIVIKNDDKAFFEKFKIFIIDVAFNYRSIFINDIIKGF